MSIRVIRPAKLCFFYNACGRVVRKFSKSDHDTRMDDIKAKSTGSPAFFSFPGHARLTSLADFLFHPASFGSLFAG